MATYEAGMVDDIIRYEGGEMNDEEIINLFQHLVDTGTAWVLQGHYGRTAAYLIDIGVVRPAGEGVPRA